MLTNARTTLSLLGAVLLTACGQPGDRGPEADADQSSATTTQASTDHAGDRLLITDEVASWPMVAVTQCVDYAPTHARELVLVAGAPGDCLEAAISSESAVVFSGIFDEPLSDAERSDYTRWGEQDGHEVMVRVHGAEVAAGSFDFFTAWVPDTGEYAILAGRGAPGAWPYSRPPG